MWKRLKQVFRGETGKKALVISRKHHVVSRNDVSPNALKVLYRLNQAGFAAYLVGGGVRDLLLKRKPKDFDIATNALPEQVRSLFRNSRIIGRRFRLVHVFFHDENIEVSTFRASVNEFTSEEVRALDEPETPPDENIYGTIEEDAWRRDFTVNALYYNISDFSIEDYTGGILDLKKRNIRMIGDPEQRYHEDPVRLLRAVRLAAKLNFEIEKSTEKSIPLLAGLLLHIPSARLFDEVIKLFFDGYATATYDKLLQYGLMDVLFPSTMQALITVQQKTHKRLIQLAMMAADKRFHEGKSLNPGFLFAALLWPVLQMDLQRQPKRKLFYIMLHHCINEVIHEQEKPVMIPRRMSSMIRSIWVMQYHLLKRRPKRVERILKHRYFRAALDFLDIRAESGENELLEIVAWWRKLQRANDISRERLLDELANL